MPWFHINILICDFMIGLPGGIGLTEAKRNNNVETEKSAQVPYFCTQISGKNRKSRGYLGR